MKKYREALKKLTRFDSFWLWYNFRALTGESIFEVFEEKQPFDRKQFLEQAKIEVNKKLKDFKNGKNTRNNK